jgi:hypothetical protein
LHVIDEVTPVALMLKIAVRVNRRVKPMAYAVLKGKLVRVSQVSVVSSPNIGASGSIT